MENKNKIPEWIKEDIPRKKNLNKEIESKETLEILSKLNIITVCQEAKCPNIGTCFEKKTATFMILGSKCTRDCRFCGVENGKPEQVDREEPERIVEAVKKLNLKHVVITSVTRDDLHDGGAEQFAEVISLLNNNINELTVETLTPDFMGNTEAIETVVNAGPDVFNHNIETVPRLYKTVRPQAIYKRSLKVLKYVKEKNKKILTKSGIMLGLGESENEVISVMEELRENECDFLTLGQYFQPNKNNLSIVEYIEKDIFKKLKNEAQKMGFTGVFSGTWVRSSFRAEEMLNRIASSHKLQVSS